MTSVSSNSACASRGKSKTSPKLSRLIKRGRVIRKIEDGDLRYLYAAYKLGSFKGIERDLGPQEFTTELVNGTLRATELWTPVVDEKPIGFIVVAPYENLFEVHAEWLPWAKPRQILESAVLFFHERREQRFVTSVRSDVLNFYHHVSKYGLLRKAGKLYDLYGDGEHGTIFQSAAKCH